MNRSLTLTSVPQQVWIQALGRGLYQLGSAVLLFYTPIVFVNYGGLSAATVGLAIGGGSLVGFAGNLLGGGMADSQLFGRKGTLVVSTVLAIAAAGVAIIAQNFASLLSSNILFGLSVGLYWTAADAAVMDSTTPEQRQPSFSILGVMDNLGFGIGTLSGGLLLKILHPETLVFGASAAVFALFGLLTIGAVAETRQDQDSTLSTPQTGWKQAITDRRLMTYLVVNTQFVTFLALVGSTLPLYFVNVTASTETTVSNLFTGGYVGLGALIQVPLVRIISHLSYVRSLMLSLLIWGFGFGLIWALGVDSPIKVGAELAVFALFAFATVIYKPTSSAWISELAPPSLRGVYTAIAYQCWSLGYVIGPVLGGWALDQPQTVTRTFWLAVAVSTIGGLGILKLLDQKNQALTLPPDSEPSILKQPQL
jgi:MFS family permease